MFSLILQLRQYSQTSTNGHLSTKSMFLFRCTVHLHSFSYFHIKYSFSISIFELFLLSALFNIRHECTTTLCSQLPNKIVQCSLQCFSSPWSWNFVYSRLKFQLCNKFLINQSNFLGTILGGETLCLFCTELTEFSPYSQDLQPISPRTILVLGQYCPDFTITSKQYSSCTFIRSKFPSALTRSPTFILLCFTLPILNRIGIEKGWNDCAPEKTDGQSAPSVFLLIDPPMLCKKV